MTRDDRRSLALTDGEVAEFRQRILAGVYRTAAVIDVVARRIVESGDL